LYLKHCTFFAGGSEFNERALLGGNKSGKSIAGAYETTCHLTGKYPRWWRGRVFDEPVSAWGAGDTGKTVRDILQTILMGPPGDASAEGTGMIPGDLILGTSNKYGLSDCYESVRVRHSSGGASVLQFKSYDQGRAAFQGTNQHVIWADEECPMEIWTEMLLRTMVVNGIIYLTATPLLGLTEIMLSFLPDMQPIPT
jgi:phage terminase large subunit-like protein